jgi:hypothetical protein
VKQRAQRVRTTISGSAATIRTLVHCDLKDSRIKDGKEGQVGRIRGLLDAAEEQSKDVISCHDGEANTFTHEPKRNTSRMFVANNGRYTSTEIGFGGITTGKSGRPATG